MYFLSQIKKQFIHALCTFELPSGAEGTVDTSAAANDNQENFTQNEISNMSSSEILEELKERLDIVKAGEGIVWTKADVLMRFCMKVKNNEVHGYTTADADYKRLVEMVQLAVIEYRGLAGEAAQIDESIRVELARIGAHIDREITNPEENTVLSEDERKEQEELWKLEIQRDSYAGILREMMNEYTEERRNNFSPQIQILIKNIEEGLEVDVSEESNEKIWNELSMLWWYIEFEWYKGGIRWIFARIPEDRIPDELKEEINIYLWQSFSIENIDDNRISEISTANETGKELLEKLYERIKLTEEEEEKYKELSEKFNNELDSIKEKLSEYTDKEDNTLSMQTTLWLYDRISDRIWKGITNFHRLQILEDNYLEANESFSNLDELSTLTDIALRDEWIVWEDWEKLGDVREKSSNEAYEKALEDDSVETALKDWEGNTPKFEELRMNDIVILREAGVNLAEIFLVDTGWQSISGNIETWKNYIINFGTNTHLSWKMNFAFIAMDTQKISVDGKELSFDSNSFKYEWELYNMREGSLIEVHANFEDNDTPAQVTRHEWIREQMNNLGVADTHQEIIQTALMSSNPQWALDMSTLPWWLAGWLIAMVLNFWDGRNFKYDAERGIFVDQEDELLTAEGALNGSRGVYYDSGQRVDVNSSFEDLPPGVGNLVNTIYQAESRGDPNIIYGWCPIQPPKPITQMTVREVRNFQDQMVRAWSASSAVGACQIIRGTMDGAIRAWALDPNQKFDVTAQNKFTIWKMEQRGLNRFMSGDMSDTDFMKSLSQEWASLPKDMWWASYYAWDWLNHALVSPQTMMSHLKEIWQW